MANANYNALFEKVRTINNKYLKPADEEYKILEEYGLESDIYCVELLADAYKLLLGAINSMSGNLDEYIKMLQNLRIRAICKLLIKRIIDLITTKGARITKNDKAKIKSELLVIYQGLTSTRKKVADNINIARLDQMITQWKGTYTYIEKTCRKYI